MKTLYAACLTRLGLSLPEAAKHHGVRLDTVKSWSSGRNRVPVGVWDDLRDLERKIGEASLTIREIWEEASEPLEVSARWHDDVGLLGYADFILTAPVLPIDPDNRG